MSQAHIIVRSKELGERAFALSNKRLAIGRSPELDLTLPDRKVSSFHAEIVNEGDGWRLRDLGSTNGTFVNGLQITEHRLVHEDKILIGTTELVYSATGDRVGDRKRLRPPTVHDEGLPPELERPGDFIEAGEKLREAMGSGPAGLEELKRTPVAGVSAADGLERLRASPGALQGRETVRISFHDLEKEVIEGSAKFKDNAAYLKAHQMLAVLYKLSASINALSTLDDLLEKILDFIFEVVDTDRAFIFFLDEATRSLVPKAIRKQSGIRDGKGKGLSVSTGLLKQALAEGQAIVTRDAQMDDRFNTNQSIFLYNIHSAMTIPLTSKDKILGVVHLDKLKARRPFVDDDLKLMAIICNQAATAISNAQLFGEVRKANEELEEAKERIRKHNLELEQKVEERTLEIRKQNEEISQLADMKDELLGMVAHDLRTPLTGIIGFSEIILQVLDAGMPAETMKEDVEVIHRTAGEMNSLLSDLLDISKIESGKITIQPEMRNAGTMLREGYPTYKRWTESKGIRFQLEVAEGIPDVPLDPRRFGQIINNLLSNAIKFSHPDDTISVVARGNGEWVEIVVSDTGQGIDPNEISKIFGKFEQAPSSQATKGEAGTGLGLAITKRLVELHGGKIRVDSQRGVGTRFTIALAVAGPDAAARPEEADASDTPPAGAVTAAQSATRPVARPPGGVEPRPAASSGNWEHDSDIIPPDQLP